MDWVSVLKVSIAVLASLGGGGALVLALSSYLGKLWANRLLAAEKHKWDDILQTAKSELDKATNRYQVGLDSLSLVHKLRTTEEFARLGELWRHMAILQNAFAEATRRGLVFMPPDRAKREEYQGEIQRRYEKALDDASRFFFEQKLFIPRAIADCAEETLRALFQERNFYAAFGCQVEHSVRQHYEPELDKQRKVFNKGLTNLEVLMREHIEGVKVGL